MGRELKFRAWDGNVLHSVDELHFPQGGVKWYGPGMGQGWAKDCPVMQFTGLKDRNGAEVWEGDVVDIKRRDDPNIYQVVVKDIRFLPEDFFGSGFEWSEVIGNIFANPELLERP